MRRRLVPLLVGALALAALPPAAGAQIVQNGGFEDNPANCTGSFRTLAVGSTLLSPWAITAGNLDWICTLWVDDEGTRSLDMNGTSAATISQTVSLLPGATYQLSFAMAGNPQTGGSTKTMEVMVGSVLTDNFTFSTVGRSTSNMGWVTHTRNFVASQASTLLQFRSTMSGSGGPALDDVSIVLLAPPTAIPEPATVALVAAGLGVLGVAARRRRA